MSTSLSEDILQSQIRTYREAIARRDREDTERYCERHRETIDANAFLANELLVKNGICVSCGEKITT